MTMKLPRFGRSEHHPQLWTRTPRQARRSPYSFMEARFVREGGFQAADGQAERGPQTEARRAWANALNRTGVILATRRNCRVNALWSM